MKNLKVLFATLAVATLIVGAFAFSTKKVDVVTYYYIAANKQIGTAANHLVQSEVEEPTNWTLTDPGYTFSDQDFMAAITFDQDALDKQDAIDAVWANFAPSSTLPREGQTLTINGVSVTIHRKANNQ